MKDSKFVFQKWKKLFVLDMNGAVNGWNKPKEQMWGRPADGMLGKGNYEFALRFYNGWHPTASNLIFKENPKLEPRRSCHMVA